MGQHGISSAKRGFENGQQRSMRQYRERFEVNYARDRGVGCDSDVLAVKEDPHSYKRIYRLSIRQDSCRNRVGESQQKKKSQ